MRCRVGRTFLLLISAAAVFLGVLFLFPTSKPKPTWTASDHTPIPADFLYAMFPLNNAVGLFDVPDGSPVDTLRRAVVNSQEEIEAGGWVKVRNPNKPGWVRLGDLGCLPPPEASADYFGAFVSEYRSGPGNEFRSATIDIRTDSAGVTTAKLHLRIDDDHVEEFVYQILSGAAKPLEMYRYFGPGVALKSVVPAILTGAVAAAIVMVGGFAVSRRR